MSNVVDALERLGRQSGLRYAEGEALLQALARGGLDSSLQAAIVRQDATSLQALVGVHSHSIGLVYAPEEKEDEEPEEQAPQRSEYSI